MSFKIATTIGLATAFSTRVLEILGPDWLTHAHNDRCNDRIEEVYGIEVVGSQSQAKAPR